MKVAVFSTHKFEKENLTLANGAKHELCFIESSLNNQTVVMASGCETISIFVNDDASAENLRKLHELGVKYVSLRSAGYNNVDLSALAELNMAASRVPAYSPYAVAEHTIGLMLALNRKLIRAHNRVNDFNFSLEGLVGFDMHGKTVGIIGTGRIGSIVARIMSGFGCKLLAYDTVENEELKENFNIEYTDCMTLCRQSDIITLHAPLTKETKYLIDKHCIDAMKEGVMLINTSRGALVNTKEVIEALKTGHIGYFGMDVYEEEEHLFFEDHSEDIPKDELLARLMTFKNVLITGHQAFLTREAIQNIALTTIHNIDCFEKGIKSGNEIQLQDMIHLYP